MTKYCELCGGEFFARWRNDPAICPDCLQRSHARICPDCLRAHGMEHDPAQLELLPVSRAAVVPATPDYAPYVRPARSASRAAQLRNPFH